MKELPPGGEEEDEEEEGKGDKMEENNKKGGVNISDTDSEAEETNASISQETAPSETEEAIQKHRLKGERTYYFRKELKRPIFKFCVAIQCSLGATRG